MTYVPEKDENIFSVLSNHSNRLGEIFSIAMQLSTRLGVLEGKIEKIETLKDSVNSLQRYKEEVERNSILQREEIERQKQLIEKIHLDLQKLGSIKNHILTASAALGGAIAAYLIHFLPHI